MVGRRYVYVPGLDRAAILSESSNMPPTEQMRQNAGVGANVHDHEDRRSAGNRQRRYDASEGIKSTG
jgi:hypothetical protein